MAILVPFSFFFIPHPAEYGVDVFRSLRILYFATVPTLGFRWGLIWSISGLLGGVWVSCRVVLDGYQVDPWSTYQMAWH